MSGMAEEIGFHRQNPVVEIDAADVARTFPVTETEKMATAIPNSRFIVLPEVGHLAALEHPELINTLIDSFLSDVGIATKN